MNNHREMPEVAWYLIQCKTRQMNCAGEHLAHQGFECFNPSIRVEKLHADKVKQQEQPMFPGYLFAKIKNAQDNWTAPNSTRSVSRVVNCCSQSIPQMATKLSERTKTKQDLEPSRQGAPRTFPHL